MQRCCLCVQEAQVEYLEDSEVDFSSDDDDEDDMEDFVGPDEGRRSAGHLGKRPSGISFAAPTGSAVGFVAAVTAAHRAYSLLHSVSQ